MSGRKTHNELCNIFRAGGSMARRARNAATGRTGVMYEVTTNGKVSTMFYWGSPVVSWDRTDDTLTFQTNGHETVTTKALINATLDALKVQGRLFQTDHVRRFHRPGHDTPLDFKDGMKVKISDHFRDLMPV